MRSYPSGRLCASSQPPRPQSRPFVQLGLLTALMLAFGTWGLLVGTGPASAVTPPLPEPSPSRAPPPPPPETSKFLSDEENRFRKSVASLISEALERDISDSDRDQLQAAATAVARGNLRQIIIHRAAIADPVAVKIVDWMKLEAGYGTASEYLEFVKSSPLWPIGDRFRQNLEKATLLQGGTVGDLKELFERFPPQTGMGQAALASAKLTAGDQSAAAELARRAWREDGLSATVETGILQRFGQLLRPEDHLARINHLLAADYTSRNARRRRAAMVRRVVPLLSDAEKPIVEARIAIYLDDKNRDKLLKALPEKAQADPQLKRQQAQALRRRKRLKSASELLASLPAGLESQAAEADWLMRQRLARAMLEAGEVKLAFELVERARPPDANEAIEAAFLAGWLALRKLGQPEQALTHFERLDDVANGPLSRSRAAYWLGRAHRELSNDAKAAEEFARAAAHRDTFHGALARIHRENPDRSLELPLPPLPDARIAETFAEQDIVQAMVIAHKADLPRRAVRKLFNHFAWTNEDAKQLVLAAQLADELDDTQLSVRIGKAAVSNGHPLYIYAYPVHRFPIFEPLTDEPEPELILSIARQESEFNTQAVSRAGARGLLQVMPATARGVCRSYRISCKVSQLNSNLSFNARIAAAYITDQSEAVDGNMILTLTSYNAGPGRTRQWLRERGDPRKPERDALDWVYEIPFEETRLYVQKVISNLQVYRARLGSEAPIQIDRDLGMAIGR